MGQCDCFCSGSLFWVQNALAFVGACALLLRSLPVTVGCGPEKSHLDETDD